MMQARLYVEVRVYKYSNKHINYTIKKKKEGKVDGYEEGI